PKIKLNPTREDALAALTIIKQVYREFPFVVDTDRSVFLSAYLTTAARAMLPFVPLHGFTAPEAGSGKSKLVESIGIVFTASPPSATTPGHSEEEFEKRLGAALLEGDTFISFDNCVQPLDGVMLCQA